MIRVKLNSVLIINRMRKIAEECINNGYDLLLACRELADIYNSISSDSIDGMDIFIGVASEVDGLPIGPERSHWSVEALRIKDAEISSYRNQVKDVVLAAMSELLWTLNTRKKELGAM